MHTKVLAGKLKMVCERPLVAWHPSGPGSIVNALRCPAKVIF